MRVDYPWIGDAGGLDAVVLANGVFPTAAEPLALLRHAPFVCACDGASRWYPEADVIVGDGDSVPEALRQRLIRVSEQEDNDLTKATRYCLSLGHRRIGYLGATGGREDHTIGNLSLIVRYYSEMDVAPLLATDYGWFVVAQGERCFSSFAGQQVSIFNISCSDLVSARLRWQAYPYSQLWQGTLNEAVAASFTLSGDGIYVVYRTYLAKGD